ncbi:anti-sigma F factor [Clostridium sp. E02]|uniref:anti-sigma F factor n=1 Tax=Clostridium sp. E02 TaxID=2487134 RepID=UPI000F52CE43|nr:anti-sigma F factor [Clostridium sp. E02]
MSEQNKPEILKMEVEALSKNEEFARVAVAVFMARLNPTIEEVDDVKTAVSEAVTNAVIHGYQGNGGIIYLEVGVDHQDIIITIKDTGIGIPDIKLAMEPMYTTDPDGARSGMGFSFMEAFMDEVEVISTPDEGTAVTMKKKING